MAGQIIWTHQAWDDLESAADFIARDSPRYAAAFVREVRDASQSLKLFPRRGRVVPELNDPSLRELLVRNHRLIYSVEPQATFILAFIHGARDLPALWDERERP